MIGNSCRKAAAVAAASKIFFFLFLSHALLFLPLFSSFFRTLNWTERFEKLKKKKNGGIDRRFVARGFVRGKKNGAKKKNLITRRKRRRQRRHVQRVQQSIRHVFRFILTCLGVHKSRLQYLYIIIINNNNFNSLIFFLPLLLLLPLFSLLFFPFQS